MYACIQEIQIQNTRYIIYMVAETENKLNPLKSCHIFYIPIQIFLHFLLYSENNNEFS